MALLKLYFILPPSGLLDTPAVVQIRSATPEVAAGAEEKVYQPTRREEILGVMRVRPTPQPVTRLKDVYEYGFFCLLRF